MPTRSLTQNEAEQRSALIAVERYDVSVDLTDLPTGPEVRCQVTVTFTCRQPGAETFVECAADVLTATLNGRPVGPAADGRLALPDLAEHNLLRVDTVQANTTSGEGVHKAVDPADGEVYVWMSFEPDEAHHVWACFDQPDLKAPHAFTVTAPAGWTVVSNSGDARVESVAAATRWTFPDTPALSTYNTVVSAGPLHQIRRLAGGHDLGLYVRRSLAAVLDRDADEIFTVTEQGLGFFGDVFGMPFPQHRYDQVFMPEFGGAMENYGCVTWSDAFLARTAPTPAERERLAKVLLHEMAHMWFGNIVTMRWWDDLWLNEAFAEFACNWAAVRATAYTDAWAGHLADWKLSAYVSDQGPTSHPIYQPVHDVAQASSVFDNITYPKGASVLKQLMTYVGEDEFSAGMSAYFAQHAWGNTTLQDLVDALAGTSGRDLAAWSAGWLETAGTDRFTLEQDGDGLTLVGRGPRGDPRPQVLLVGAYRAGTGALDRAAVAEVEVTQARTAVDLPTGLDLYLINDEDLTFATARPAEGATASVLALTGALPTSISRGVAVAMVWDMLVSGEASAADAVGCLTAVLAVETSDSVIEPYLRLATEVAERWAPPAERARLTAAVSDSCRLIARQPSRRRVALRALAATAADLDEVGRLQSEAGGDRDLQWRLLVRAAELGADTTARSRLLLDRDPDPDAWTRALAVRAATPDPAEKDAVWQTLAVDRQVPIGSMSQAVNAFWRPGQDDVLSPYTERYLDLLPTLGQAGMIPAMAYTGWLFPVFAVDHAYLERAVAAATDASPVVRQTLVEQADLVSRMLSSRA